MIKILLILAVCFLALGVLTQNDANQAYFFLVGTFLVISAGLTKVGRV